MQFKNSMLLMTALTAGSAVARLHGHQRRHEHKSFSKVELEVEGPSATKAPEFEIEMERRAVGDVVSCTIDGVLQTWINNWSGQVSAETSSSAAAAAAATSTSTSTTETPTPTPTETPTQSVEATASPSGVESTVSPVATSGGGGDWTTYPESGNFCREGFGTSNYEPGNLGVMWSGNTGTPWGSNIIEVEESKANQYKNVIRFEGSNTEDWTVLFWNKKGPDGKMTGWFSPNKAISFTLAPKAVKYVAIDSESTGGWTAFEGDSSPLSWIGSYAATWGEFTMRNSPDTSSWDVSCIQAENAKKAISGMKICEHHHGQCSSITKNKGNVTNAYTSAETDENGIGGNIQAEAVRLLVNLDWAGDE